MPAAKNEDIFEQLRGVDVTDKIEEKDTGSAKLKYLSWAWAWHEVRRRCPDATYTIIKNENNLPYFVDPGMGIMVYTTVTIGGETHEMWLPVMDGANNPMKLEPYEYQVKNYKFKYAKWNEAKKGYFDSYGNPQPEYITKKVDAATMFDVNKTIMRCLTKNLAMFGLGLALYAGEDLFDDTEGNKGEPVRKEEPDTKALVEEVDKKVQSMIVNMSREQKDALLKKIESKIGMKNYRNCTDAKALSELLNDLKAA